MLTYSALSALFMGPRAGSDLEIAIGQHLFSRLSSQIARCNLHLKMAPFLQNVPRLGLMLDVDLHRFPAQQIHKQAAIRRHESKYCNISVLRVSLPFLASSSTSLCNPILTQCVEVKTPPKTSSGDGIESPTSGTQIH